MGKKRKYTKEEIFEKQRRERMTKHNLTEREILWQAAYHEAGHAVIHRYFNIPNIEAYIDKYGGEVTTVSSKEIYHRSYIFGWKSIKPIFRGCIISTYAGFFAQSRYAGWNKHPDRKEWYWENGGTWHSMSPLADTFDLGDNLTIIELAEALSLLEDWGLPRYEKAYTREARRLVNRLWPWIDAFAKLLFKRKKLGYKAIEAFFRRHPMERINLKFKPLKRWRWRWRHKTRDLWDSRTIDWELKKHRSKRHNPDEEG